MKIQIADKDMAMVALEEKYQKLCYEKYTLFLRHNMQSTEEENEKQVYKYEKSFDVSVKTLLLKSLSNRIIYIT